MRTHARTHTHVNTRHTHRRPREKAWIDQSHRDGAYAHAHVPRLSVHYRGACLWYDEGGRCAPMSVRTDVRVCAYLHVLWLGDCTNDSLLRPFPLSLPVRLLAWSFAAPLVCSHCRSVSLLLSLPYSSLHHSLPPSRSLPHGLSMLC